MGEAHAHHFWVFKIHNLQLGIGESHHCERAVQGCARRTKRAQMDVQQTFCGARLRATRWREKLSPRHRRACVHACPATRMIQ
eukprot:931586-Prymnesium_polylepis.1